MRLFGGVVPVTGIAFLMLSVFAIAACGYALGRITIKGVSLGTAGVFLVALLYGALFSEQLGATLSQRSADGALVDYSANALKIIENIGLVLFVASVGFIAGPGFVKNLKLHCKSYILLGVVIILAGGLTCAACFFLGRGREEDAKEFVALLVGILSGSLTSTPAFSAAKASVLSEYESAVTVGHGIAYLFGVIGVVLFVQLIPKLCKADMAAERAKMKAVQDGERTPNTGRLIRLDPFGLLAFSAAAVMGVLLGAIRIPLTADGLSGTSFSLTTTGGVLLTSLMFGQIGRVGRLDLKLEKRVSEVFREFGLMLFLIGAGVAGGAEFVQYFKPIYFLYGVVMTLVPMIVGFFFAKYGLKLALLNNLGAITGGMTSTPALGALIHCSGTHDIASAYAATYPIALICVVVASQLIILLL